MVSVTFVPHSIMGKQWCHSLKTYVHMSDASLSICKMYLDKFIYQYLELISFINISVALSVF